jgi:hypothetical protein
MGAATDSLVGRAAASEACSWRSLIPERSSFSQPPLWLELNVLLQRL